MNESTLLKLKNNPHYKMSKKQTAELNEIEREMEVIGSGEAHNQVSGSHNNSFQRPKKVRKYNK